MAVEDKLVGTTTGREPKTGFTFTGLVITGDAKSVAAIPLTAGLNLFVGDSDTGKSHIREHIDHLAGSSRSPKRFPENEGYTATYLGVRPRNGDEITLRRSFDDGDLLLFPAPIASIEGVGASQTLKWRHDSGTDATVSSLLLSFVGLNGKKLRKNKRGETDSLTFRHLAHLCFVSETGMLRVGSPVLSDNKPQNTPGQAAFLLLLTGRDDSALTSTPDPKIRKAQLQAQQDLLRQLIEDRDASLKKLGIGADEAETELKRIDLAVREATSVLSALNVEITGLESDRQATFQNLRPIEARLVVLQELLARFELLAEHYGSDIERLEAMLEAGSSFVELETAPCPLCHSTFADGSPRITQGEDLAQFSRACQNETDKIRLLRGDLDATRLTMARERDELAGRRTVLHTSINDINSRLASSLEPRVRTTQVELDQIMAARSDRGKAVSLAQELQDLRRRVTTFEAELKKKNPKKFQAAVDPGPYERFAQIVEDLLRAWQYPNLQRVTFDESNLDVIVSGRARGSLGKGYRAITHAAFIIAIMKYCREFNLPHPGVVILDSPLVTLRQTVTVGPPTPSAGPRSEETSSSSDTDETIPLGMKDAFYISLANDQSGDQFIILENDEPPAAIENIANVVHFTGNRNFGRYGLFPVL